jgi:tetratricopeptide (TPR) repeat protein
MIDRALLLNPNQAAAWNASGWVRTFLGETNVAIENLSRAVRLGPLDPQMFWMQTVTAMAHFMAGQYEVTSMAAAKAVCEQPDFLAAFRLVAASNALAGRLDKASEAVTHALQLDPGQRGKPPSSIRTIVRHTTCWLSHCCPRPGWGGRLRTAIANLPRCLRIGPCGWTGSDPWAHLGLGLLAFTGRQTDEALRHFRPRWTSTQTPRLPLASSPLHSSLMGGQTRQWCVSSRPCA